MEGAIQAAQGRAGAVITVGNPVLNLYEAIAIEAFRRESKTCPEPC